MLNVNLLVKKYNSFDRSNGQHGQVITVAINGRNVNVESVDKEVFDFSFLKPDKAYDFEFDVIHRFNKALSKNDKSFYLNYLTLVLKSCNDIELD